MPILTFHALASSSHGNAYLVSDGDTRILVECGISWKQLQQRLGFSIATLDGVLLSHEHKDHSHCHDKMTKSGLAVYASLGTATALKNELIQVVDAGEAFSIGTLDVLPFPVFHDAQEPFGFLIRSRRDGEKLLFATDTVNLAYQCPGVNLVAIECNYSQPILERSTRMPASVRTRIMNTHMEVGNTVAWLKQLDKGYCRKVYLLHLSDFSSNEEEFLHRVGKVCPGIDVEVCPR